MTQQAQKKRHLALLRLVKIRSPNLAPELAGTVAICADYRGSARGGCVQILEMFGIAGSAGAVIGAVLLFGLRRYAGSYLSEKGKGLATKEDIGEITTIVESIRQENVLKLAELSEALRAQTSLRLLAGERRLETHQKAYVLWRELIDYCHSDNNFFRQDLYDKNLAFYFGNCLYLDPKVRLAFVEALTSFAVHPELLKHQHGTTVNSREQMVHAITKNMDQIRQLGTAIAEACDLPSIGRDLKPFKGEK